MSFDCLDFTPLMQSEALPMPLIPAGGGAAAEAGPLLALNAGAAGEGRGGPPAAPTDSAFENLLEARGAGGRSRPLPPPFAFLLGSDDEPVATSAYEGDPDGDDDGDGIPNKDDEDSIIVVDGTRPKTYNPDPSADTGGGSPGGTGMTSGEYKHSEDDPCADGAAVEIKRKIVILVEQIGGYEFGAFISKNGDGSFGALNDKIYTDYRPGDVTMNNPEDASAVHGIIHNHVWNTKVDDPNWNAKNRYPSADDWNALDKLVMLGADAFTLSIYVIDAWGVVREFKYEDKNLYESMSNQQRVAGENLPGETSPCGPAT
jgi:hypothetical protein